MKIIINNQELTEKQQECYEYSFHFAEFTHGIGNGLRFLEENYGELNHVTIEYRKFMNKEIERMRNIYIKPYEDSGDSKTISLLLGKECGF